MPTMTQASKYKLFSYKKSLSALPRCIVLITILSNLFNSIKSNKRDIEIPYLLEVPTYPCLTYKETS